MSVKTNPVVWFEIYANDVDRAQKFYETVLDKKMQRLDGKDYEMAFFAWADDMNAPNASGAICRMEGMKPGGNGTVVYFGCDDCAVEESRVETAGGKILQTKFSIGEHGFISLFLDIEGNTVGLHSMK